MKEKLAIQLYSVRQETKQDFPGVLRELQAQGWAGVETAGLQGYSAGEIAAVLRETGLRAAGMHVGLDRLRGDLQEVLREAETLGCTDLICPSVPDSDRTPGGFQAIRAELNHLARTLAPRGYRVSYHNHAFEFRTQVGSMSALEFLIEPTPENHILAQIDTYWVYRGGRDPLSFMRPYAGRMPLVHLKDLDAQGNDVATGAGIIGFGPILAWGERSGVEWYVVESEVQHGAMAVAGESLRNLHALIGQIREQGTHA